MRREQKTAGAFVYKEAVLDELSARKEEYLTRISVFLTDSQEEPQPCRQAAKQQTPYVPEES